MAKKMPAVHDQLHDQAVQLGSTLQRLRKSRGMTQAELATALSHRGVPWLQQNVVRAEKGVGRLRFDEVCAIADVLGVPIEALRDDADTVEDIVRLYEHIDGHMWALGQIIDAAEALHKARREAQETLQELVASGDWDKLPERLLVQVDALARGADARMAVEMTLAEQEASTPLVSGPGDLGAWLRGRDGDWEPAHKFDPEVWA